MNDFLSVKTGDLIYLSGEGFVSWIIKRCTGGRISHVGVIYDDRWVFETDGKWRKAQMFPLKKYLNACVFVRRLKTMTEEHRVEIKNLCEKYNNTPYSYWDIILNAVATPFPSKWRKSFVTTLGTKAYMKCDEMSRRIIFESTGYLAFENFENSNPSEMFNDCEWSNDFDVVI